MDRYKFNGKNIRWIYKGVVKVNGQYSLNNGHNFNPNKDSIICSCSGCYYDPLSIISIDEIKKTRNYKNVHCMDCTRKYCVCDVRRMNGEYNIHGPSIPYWDNACNGCCYICSNNKSDGIPTIVIQKHVQYYTVLNIVEVILYKRLVNLIKDNLNYPILNRNVVDIILLYISTEYINPTLVTNITHKIPDTWILTNIFNPGMRNHMPIV
jgi:hypothetical protein